MNTGPRRDNDIARQARGTRRGPGNAHIAKAAGTHTGTVRDGLSRLGPVCIPRTKPAGYPPGIPHGPREV